MAQQILNDQAARRGSQLSTSHRPSTRGSRVVTTAAAPQWMSNVRTGSLTSSTTLPRQPSFVSGFSTMAGSVGEGRVIQESEITAEHRVISEKTVENQIKVPRKIIREEVQERVVVVPERIAVEEVVEETVKVRERIVEVAKPIYTEKIVEVPEIEIVERIVEVPEIIIREKIREVPKVEIVERVSRVPRVVIKEKIVEVPEYEYREVPVEKIVEVPEFQEEIITKEIPVEKIVEIPVPTYQTIEVPQDIDRYLPIPVEAITYYEFRLPKVTAKYKTTPYPIYAPRFIEVPIPTSAIDATQMEEVNFVHDNVTALCANPCPNLCEVEKLAEYAKTRNYNFQIDENALQRKFVHGQI